MTRRLLAVAILLTVLIPGEVAAQQAVRPTVLALQLRVVDLKLRVETPEGVRGESPSQVDFAIAGDVLFAFNEATLTPAAAAILSSLAHDIKAQATGPVKIVGYTDEVGELAFNLDLSRRRAQAVEADLNRLLAGTPTQFTTDGRGEADPVSPNKNEDGSDNPPGRARNRRVTVTYAKRPASSSTTTTSSRAP